jgi:nicotinamidase-related amidase
MKELHTALVVIDMQADYIGKTSRYDYYPDTLIDKVNERIALTVEQDELVIYVINAGRRNKKLYISDFVEGLSVVSDNILTKGKSSIFDNADLLGLLREKNISKIEMIGIDGNCCVAASAIDAANLGFAVTYPLKYIGIMSNGRFAKTRDKLLKANVEIIELQEDICFE